MQRHALGGQGSVCPSSYSKLVGNCPVLSVVRGGVAVPCQVDTASMVTIITGSFFHRHFFHLRKRQCNWLGLKAANGLAIPSFGYLKMDVVVLGQHIPGRGILVVRNPEEVTLISRKTITPGILGMNILEEWYNILFEQHGSQHFHSPPFKSAAPAALHALKQCEKIKAIVNAPKPFKVKVQGRASVCLGAGTLSMVPVTCPQLESAESLLEPLGFEDGQLPEGLLVSPTLVPANKDLLYAPVVNVSSIEVWLRPSCIIGTVQPVMITSVGTTPIAVDTRGEDGCVYISTQELTTCPSIPDLKGWCSQSPLGGVTYRTVERRGNQNYKGDWGDR